MSVYTEMLLEYVAAYQRQSNTVKIFLKEKSIWRDGARICHNLLKANEILLNMSERKTVYRDMLL